MEDKQIEQDMKQMNLSSDEFIGYMTKQMQQAAQQPTITLTTSQIQKDVVINNQILIPNTLVDFFQITLPQVTGLGKLPCFVSDCWPFYQQLRIYLNNELIETINDAHLYSKQNNYLLKEDEINTGKYFYQRPLEYKYVDAQNIPIVTSILTSQFTTAGTQATGGLAITNTAVNPLLGTSTSSNHLYQYIDTDRNPQTFINDNPYMLQGVVSTNSYGKCYKQQKTFQQFSSLGVMTDGTNILGNTPYVSCKLCKTYPNTFFSIDKPIYVKNLRFEMVFNSIVNIYAMLGGASTLQPIFVPKSNDQTCLQISDTTNAQSSTSLVLSEQYMLFDSLIDQSLDMRRKVCNQNILWYHAFIYNNTQPSFNIDISSREMGIISHVCISHFDTYFADVNSSASQQNKLNVYQSNILDRCGQSKIDQLIINCNGTEICNRNIGTIQNQVTGLQNSQFNLLMNFFYDQLRKHPQVIKKDISYNDFLYYNTPLMINYQNPSIQFSGIENVGQFNISFQQSFVACEQQPTNFIYKTFISVVGVKELSYNQEFDIIIR